MRIASRGYVPTALAAAALATIAAGLIATPASAATQPTAPSFMSVNYEGESFTPDDYDTVSIGAESGVSFTLRTHDVTAGTATVRDDDGAELCTARIMAGPTGLAFCKTSVPLTPGTHDVTATSTSAAGVSAQSSVLHVAVYGDDSNEGGEDGNGEGGETTEPVVAIPNPGVTDPGFTVTEPVVAIPNPGVTDPGFTVTEPVESANPIAAPKATEGHRVGDLLSVLFDVPNLGNNGGSGKIKIYDASGTLVQTREWNGPVGSEGLSILLNAPHGQKTVYTAEYVLPKGTSDRTEIVLDSTNADLPAPRFAWEPTVQDKRLFIDAKGIPGATVTFTDSNGTTTQKTPNVIGGIQFQGTVLANTENTYSIVQEKDGQTSAPLTYVVDTRVGGGENPGNGGGEGEGPGNGGEGENGGGETPGAGEIAAPIVSAGKVDANGRTATLTIPSVAGTTGYYLITDEAGNTTKVRINPRWEYSVKVSHTGAQTMKVVKQVGEQTSAATEFRITGL